MAKFSWFMDLKKERAVNNCQDETVRGERDQLPGLLMGPLWLLVGYVLKRAGAHLVFPINEERLIVLYGRAEAGLIKNLKGEGRLYDPIVVDDAAFAKWVVDNRDAIILTAADYKEERQSPLPDMDTWERHRSCYLIGDRDDVDDGMVMCYLVGK